MSFTLLSDNIDSEDKRSQITAAIYAADQLLLQWQSNTDLWQQLLQQVFGCTADIDLGDITVEILDSNIMAGLRGAYAPVAPDGDERIYINGDWLISASNDEIEAVLLEEIGHAIDFRLNGYEDTPGDEGAVFSALIRCVDIPIDEIKQNDHHTLNINGQKISVEHGSRFNYGFSKGDCWQLYRKATRLKNTPFNLLNAFLKMNMTMTDVRPRVDNSNDGFSRPVFLVVSHLHGS